MKAPQTSSDMKNENMLREQCKRYSKIDFSEEVYERKQYLLNLSLEEIRTKFRIRGNMIGVKFNMKNRKDFAADLWACTGCGAVDTFLHLKWCPT